jgi:hypothetical protein
MFDSELALDHRERCLADSHLEDEIEQRVMRAYVQLIFQPEGIGRSRTVTLQRFSSLEVRLTELPRDKTLEGVPPFWLELFSADGSSFDSLGFFDFDDTEIRSAVELIVDAMRELDEPAAAGGR